MAFDITNLVRTFPPSSVGTPSATQTVTDATTSTSTLDLLAAYKFFRVYGYITSYVVGTATLGPMIELQLGVTDFATLTTVATYQGNNVASSTAGQSFFMEGIYPLVAGARYAKLIVTLSGNSSVSFDAFIDAF